MSETLENIELRSEEVQEVLTKVPHWMIRWGSALLLFLIVMVLALSYFIQYPDVILAESVITTEIPPEKVYAKINEKIESILVEDNQEVQKNSPLAVLKSSANYQDVFLLKTIVDTISLNTRFFDFPINEIPILFLGDLAGDYAIFENNYIAYQLNKEYQPYAFEATANALSLSELKSRLQNTISQKQINYKELRLERKNLQRQKSLYKKGVISQQEYENERLQLLKAEKNYTAMNNTISQLKEAIATSDKNVKGTEINRTKEEIELLQRVIQSFNELKKAIKNWELQYVLKSNTNGQVVFLDYWSPTQTVTAGDLIFTVIPKENGQFIAKLKAPSTNAGKIKTGQNVHIKLNKYPENEFGVLNGTISKISSIPNEDGFYLIDVQLPEVLRTSYQKEINFTQEMQGQAEIVTEDLRLIERFFYQFRNILDSKS